MSLAAESGS